MKDSQTSTYEFDGWYQVTIEGGIVRYGRLSTEQLSGFPFLRVDTPAHDDQPDKHSLHFFDKVVSILPTTAKDAYFDMEAHDPYGLRKDALEALELPPPWQC